MTYCSIATMQLNSYTNQMNKHIASDELNLLYQYGSLHKHITEDQIIVILSHGPYHWLHYNNLISASNIFHDYVLVIYNINDTHHTINSQYSAYRVTVNDRQQQHSLAFSALIWLNFEAHSILDLFRRNSITASLLYSLQTEQKYLSKTNIIIW